MLLVHVEVFFEQINDSVVVAGEQSDEISEEKHEGAVDNPVVQVGWGHFKIQESVQLVLQCGEGLQQLLGVHLTKGAAVLPSLDFAKIECDRSVGKGLLAQVFGVTSHKGRHIVTLNSTFIEKTAELKICIARSQILNETLVSVAHKMVETDETLEDDDPVGALGALQKKVGQSRDGDIRLFRAMKKIVQVLLLGPDQLLGGGLAHGLGQPLTGQGVPGGQDPVI